MKIAPLSLTRISLFSLSFALSYVTPSEAQTPTYNQNLLLGRDGAISIELKAFSPPSCEAANVEKNFEGLCGDGANECSFSPFNDQNAWVLLGQLKEQLGTLDPKSVYFKFSLPYKNKLGFSEPTREQYIKDRKVDPIDLFSTYNFDLARLNDWRSWRQQRLDGFMEKTMRGEGEPTPPQRLVVDSRWLVSSDDEKENALENWPEWVKKGLASEIVLEGQWENPENKKLIDAARAALAGTKVKLYVALDTRRDGKAIDPLTQLLNLQGVKVDGLLVKVEQASDVARAQLFVKDILPQFPDVQ